ncbi:MAG TPA: hypothetical protein VD706_00910 [Candidatus Saccharimonadales bacterium]|nr:hypothetical protein [Candidatus Saccharimonadales bacterium]
MSGLEVYTLPLSPNRPTPFGRDAEAIFGMNGPDGEELWIPTGGKGPAYPDYDPGDAATLVLPFDDTLSQRMVTFFKQCLLPNVHRMRTIPGRWDCHSFALWMQGDITDLNVIDLGETEAIEDGRLQTAAKIKPQRLKLGELGIIGGRTEHMAVADHSVIGLSEGRGLQVLGRNSPLAIVRHERSIRAYKTVSRGTFSDKEYGMYASNPRENIFTRGYRKLFGGDERT